MGWLSVGKQQNVIFILKDHSSCYVVTGKRRSSETSKEAIAGNDRSSLDWSVNSTKKEVIRFRLFWEVESTGLDVYALVYFNLPTILWHRYYYYPYFNVENTKIIYKSVVSQFYPEWV